MKEARDPAQGKYSCDYDARERANPVEYHVLKNHPGDLHIVKGHFDDDRIPANSVIHLFRRDRPGQARGIPDIMPALPLGAS